MWGPGREAADAEPARSRSRDCDHRGRSRAGSRGPTPKGARVGATTSRSISSRSCCECNASLLNIWRGCCTSASRRVDIPHGDTSKRATAPRRSMPSAPTRPSCADAFSYQSMRCPIAMRCTSGSTRPRTTRPSGSSGLATMSSRRLSLGSRGPNLRPPGVDSYTPKTRLGAIAQLGERGHGMAEVVGSSPTSSTDSLRAQHLAGPVRARARAPSLWARSRTTTRPLAASAPASARPRGCARRGRRR
jgi:hypothetical protein